MKKILSIFLIILCSTSLGFAITLKNVHTKGNVKLIKEQNKFVWYDFSNLGSITKTYKNMGYTVSGTIGSSTLTTDFDITGYVKSNMLIKVNNADIYTVQNANANTITITTTLSSTYNAGTLIAVEAIPQLNDLSGNGFHLTNADVSALNYPTYRANAVGSLSVGSFYGNSYLKTQAANMMVSKKQGVVFFAVVSSTRAVDSQAGYIFDTGFNATSGIGMGFTGYNASLRTATNYGGASSTTVLAVPIVNKMVLVRGVIKFNNKQQIFVNGQQVGGNVAITLPYLDDTIVDQVVFGFCMGAQAKSLFNVRSFWGDIGEVILYNDDLTQDQIRYIENNLASKWGITLSS